MRVLFVTVAAFAFGVGVSGAVGGCSSSSSSSAGSGTPTCTAADGMTCPTGAGVLQLCVTGSGDQCTKAYFTVGSQTFNCNSCTDTTACQDQAAAVCYGDAGSGSSSGGSGGSSGSNSGSSSGGSSGGTDAAGE